MALVRADATEAVTTTVAPRSSSARYLTGRGTAWFRQICRAAHISAERDTLRLEIADDGLGIADHHAGIGPRTMQERAAGLGGSCQIISIRGSATTVSVRLPRHAPSEEAD